MIEQIFEEYNISESDLKIKIHETLSETYRLRPTDDLRQLIEVINHKTPTLEVVKLVSKFDQIQDEFDLCRATEIDLLRLSSYWLDYQLDDIKLERLLIKQLYRNNFNHFYELSFVLISMILVEKQQIEIDFDRDLVYDHINNNPKNFVELFDTLRASVFIQSLMKSFASKEENRFFAEQINNFSESIISYITENAVTAASMASGNLFIEAVAKNINNVNNEIGLDEPLTDKERKNFIKLFQDLNQRVTKERLGFKGSGGARERKGFKWADTNNKIRFYEMVESLPKIDGKPMWDYAFENLCETDFNYKYIDYLTSQTIFKDVPKSLFQKASNTWQKYKDTFNKPKPQEKPLAFAFDYALYLLNFPETPFSSMKKYYGEGKKLSSINSLNKETSKK